MQNSKVLGYLENLAFRLGIEVVYEKLGDADVSIEGGLCRVKGIYKIFMDPSRPLEVQVEILARALCSFNIEEVYLLPSIREILEKAQQSSPLLPHGQVPSRRGKEPRPDRRRKGTEKNS